MIAVRKKVAPLSFAFVLMLLSGCGSNIEEALFQAASATGRQAFDLFLTDVANALAAGIENIADDVTNGDDGGNGGGADGGGTDGGGDGGSGGGGGDNGGGALDGGALFAANCAACHGADGASGFAPDITGSTADEVIAAIMLGTHGSISLSDEELTAIAVWLGGDAGGSGDGGGAAGDAVAGAALFGGNNCGACHCADASGGCALNAPSLVGLSGGVLDANLRGDDPHAGGKFDLSDQEMADLETYLAGL